MDSWKNPKKLKTDMETNNRSTNLIALINTYLIDLNEENLYKVLDLLRNSEDYRKQKSEVLKYKNSPILDPDSTKIMYVPTDIEVCAVIAEINRLGLNTATYGIVVSQRHNYDYVDEEGAGKYCTHTDISFGMNGKFDAFASLDWDSCSLTVSYRHANNVVSISQDDFTTFGAGADTFNGLMYLAKMYNPMAETK